MFDQTYKPVDLSREDRGVLGRFNDRDFQHWIERHKTLIAVITGVISVVIVGVMTLVDLT